MFHKSKSHTAVTETYKNYRDPVFISSFLFCLVRKNADVFLRCLERFLKYFKNDTRYFERFLK